MNGQVNCRPLGIENHPHQTITGIPLLSSTTRESRRNLTTIF